MNPSNTVSLDDIEQLTDDTTEYITDDAEHITDDPTWNTGDFTIISSDNTRFRVPSVSIFSASQVFREAGDVSCANKTVHLTDSTFETASTVRDFFHLIMKSEFPTDWEKHDLVPLSQHVANLVDFLQKYQCDAMIRTFKLAFHYQFLVTPTSRLYSLVGLVLGSRTDDVQFCIKAIKADSWDDQGKNDHHGSSWNAKDQLNHCRRHCLTLLPCNMPLRVHELIPNSYLWALSRSWPEAGNRKKVWIGLFEELIMKSKTASA